MAAVVGMTVPHMLYHVHVHLCVSCLLQAAESAVAALNSELGVTRDELTRTKAVAARAAAADAQLVKAEGVVPAGGLCGRAERAG